MKVIHDLDNYSPEKPAMLTIGTFDGVHIGHQKILKNLVSQAKNEGCHSVVLTFSPHPRSVLQPGSSVRMIDTLEEKIEQLDRLGIDILIVQKFTLAFSRLKAEIFARDLLYQKINTRKMIIGYDHRFGKNREATVSDLTNFGRLYNFEVEVISAHEIAAITVSSTKIRQALKEGDIKTTNDYLGRPFIMQGKVVKGQAIGRTLNFPTANLQLQSEEKICPANGVFWVKRSWKNKPLYGMMNIGNRPTFAGKNSTIEVHFFDFNETLYDELLRVDVLMKIRDEIKFDSLEALQAQLQKDQEACEALYHQTPQS